MINTYQTSAFPPQLPPRPSRKAEQPAPRRGPSKAVVRVLMVVVVLHLLLSFGGFFYLYTGRMNAPLESAKPIDAGKTSARTSERTSERRSEKESHTPTAMASMTVKRPLQLPDATYKPPPGYLQWNMDHSILRNVGYYWVSWLRVQKPGDYYVYARVSFSRGGGSGLPLVSMVRLKHNETGKPRDVMKAYCSLGHLHTGQCTASQGQVLSLQVGNLLSVWVERHTWVDYESGATTFGLFKL